MAKGYVKTHTVMVNGTLNLDEAGEIIVEVEEVGNVSLKNALQELNGKPVAISVKLKEEQE